MKKIWLTLITILVLPTAAFGISEDVFETVYDSSVIPFFEQFDNGSFWGTDNIRINYVTYEPDNETGAVVILHGKSESYIKYAELAYDLRELGCAFYLMDHRGMGFSERMIKTDSQRVHVDLFDDYVEDVKTFMDTVVNQTPHAKIVFLAHSMGAAVAALYLEKYPDGADGAILSSPMLQVNTGAYPEPVAFLMASLGTMIGLGREYAPGQGPRSDPVFENNTVTHSRARWSKWELDLIPNNTQIKSGGPSFQWVWNSMVFGWMSRLLAPKVRVPVLLFQAGEDCVVLPEGQDDFCNRANNCTQIGFAGARHEILMETDSIRDAALAEIDDFYNQDR